ncbi:ankyrin repeat domain-containing protein [Streptomyces sp. NRRL F-5727]|uniref:ankyrin repeat domain-containing protein n=1 Tax=Streptomyces sp. NRRL F-5727 TaxID=1463871 RepID=UPI0006905F63|nr:ankyrin repeat domain-containing protein [Streptomyces sp. NRRL F-5727]
MTTRPLLPGGLSPEDLSSWARVRRYAVPGWMIERATEARESGDWRAACAAAAVDVPDDLDPERIADRYGAEVAAQVADDLRHLAPDLLRWHLPRTLGGHTTLAPCRRVVLAAYGRPGPVLSLTNTPMLAGPQRLRLHFGPAVPPEGDKLHGLLYVTEDWTAARRFWDARRSGELRWSAGAVDAVDHGDSLSTRKATTDSPLTTGSPVTASPATTDSPLTTGSPVTASPLAVPHARLPFLHLDGTPLTPEELPDEAPDSDSDPAALAEWIAVLQARGAHTEAYAAAGLGLDLTPPPQGPRSYRQLDVAGLTSFIAPDLTRLAHETRRLAQAGRGSAFRLDLDWRGHLRVELDPGAPEGTPPRVSGRERGQEAGIPRLPTYVWQRLPDIGLLRAGRIRPEDLHPLVTAALFPDLGGPVTGPPGPRTPGPVRVRCGGIWHEVVQRDGVLTGPHTEQERQRELALRAFGGTISGCFAAQAAWTSGRDRLPRALREQRNALFLHAQHGDTPAVVALLDAGTDPHVRDLKGRGLLHVLHLLDHRELLPRLLAAGLDLEAKDKAARTPLQTAVHEGGSVELVRELLAAGARIDVTDEMDLSLAQAIRRYERTDLMFLRRRVLREHPGLGSDWFDAYMDERDSSAVDWNADAEEDPADDKEIHP